MRTIKITASALVLLISASCTGKKSTPEQDLMLFQSNLLPTPSSFLSLNRPSSKLAPEPHEGHFQYRITQSASGPLYQLVLWDNHQDQSGKRLIGTLSSSSTISCSDSITSNPIAFRDPRAIHLLLTKFSKLSGDRKVKMRVKRYTDTTALVVIEEAHFWLSCPSLDLS